MITDVLTFALQMIRKAVKNPSDKRKMRNICLQIFTVIQDAYADDAEFN
jgi:hypothetical protein